MNFDIDNATYDDPIEDECRKIGKMFAAAIFRALRDYADYGKIAVDATRALNAWHTHDGHRKHRKGLQRRIQEFKDLDAWFMSDDRKPMSFEWLAEGAWPDAAEGRIEKCRQYIRARDFHRLANGETRRRTMR